LSYYLTKILVTTALVIVISEFAKRSSILGAILASIPLISVLAIIWLYMDTNSVEKVSALASSVFWLVLPSLAFFVSLPLLLKQDLNFYLSLSISIAITIGCYFAMIFTLNLFGIKL